MSATGRTLLLVSCVIGLHAAEPVPPPLSQLPGDVQFTLSADLPRLRALAASAAPTAAWAPRAAAAILDRLSCLPSADAGFSRLDRLFTQGGPMVAATWGPPAPDAADAALWRQVLLVDPGNEPRLAQDILGPMALGTPWAIGSWTGRTLGRFAGAVATTGLIGIGSTNDLVRCGPGRQADATAPAAALWWRCDFGPTYELISAAEEAGVRVGLDSVLPGWRTSRPVVTTEFLVEDAAWGARTTITGAGRIPGHVIDPAITAGLPEQAPLLLVAGLDPAMVAALLRNVTPRDAYARLGEMLGAGPAEVANLLSGDLCVVVAGIAVPPRAAAVIGLRPGADPGIALGVLGKALGGAPVEVAGSLPDLEIPTALGAVTVRIRTGRIIVSSDPDLLKQLSEGRPPASTPWAGCAMWSRIDLPAVLRPWLAFLANGSWSRPLAGRADALTLARAGVPWTALAIAGQSTWAAVLADEAPSLTLPDGRPWRLDPALLRQALFPLLRSGADPDQALAIWTVPEPTGSDGVAVIWREADGWHELTAPGQPAHQLDSLTRRFAGWTRRNGRDPATMPVLPGVPPMTIDASWLPTPAELGKQLRPWTLALRLTADGLVAEERGLPLVAGASTWGVLRVLLEEQHRLVRVLRQRGAKPSPVDPDPKPVTPTPAPLEF